MRLKELVEHCHKEDIRVESRLWDELYMSEWSSIKADFNLLGEDYESKRES